MANNNSKLPSWGSGRSGFTSPKVPTRISRRNASASAGTAVKGAKAGTKAGGKKK